MWRGKPLKPDFTQPPKMKKNHRKFFFPPLRIKGKQIGNPRQSRIPAGQFVFKVRAVEMVASALFCVGNHVRNGSGKEDTISPDNNPIALQRTKLSLPTEVLNSLGASFSTYSACFWQ